MPLLQLSSLEDEGHELPAGDPPLDTALAKQQMKDVLMNAVASLPRDYADVYRMRDLEDLSGEEVARRLNISLQAMKSRLHRARAMVREKLDSALGQQVRHT